MMASLPCKSLMIGWMLVFCGMAISCSSPGRSTPFDFQSQPQKEKEISESADSTMSDVGNQLPNHLMTNASRFSGRITMELKHGNPSEEHWSEADKDAHSKCQEWGYNEAEVTGTNHFEFSDYSMRRYECRGTRPSLSESVVVKVPSHQMAIAFPKTGQIQMHLEHDNPSEEHWTEADKDADNKCREWGYDEAEVTGTVLGSRQYLCRGMVELGAPEHAAETVKTTGELIDEMQTVTEQGTSGLQAITALQRLYAELQSRAEQGDAEAQDIIEKTQHSLAELQSRVEQGDLEAQRGLRLLSLVTSEAQAQMETWGCFSLSDYHKDTALFTLVRMRIDSEDIAGEVSIAGVTHFAEFRVTGLDRRWDWGCAEAAGCMYTFRIIPDGTGAYYDFTGSQDGRATASQIFNCRLSP